MDAVLKEKFRKLQDTQDTIVSTANYLIENSSESRLIVKAWNQEFTNASSEKKLTLLYLANDVLQRCKTNAFLSDFLHYLPKATAHLYKHGDKELRLSLERLVQVWTDRKVLRSNGIAAVRTRLEEVKSMTLEDSEDTLQKNEGLQRTNSQGSKRKRTGHPIVEALEETEKVAQKSLSSGNELQEFLGKSETNTLPKEELKRLNELSNQHCAMIKNEVQVRRRTVDLLKETLSEQEEGLKKSKEKLRMHFVQQADIVKLLGSPDQPNLQQHHQQQAILEDTPSLSNEMNSYQGSGGSGTHVPIAYPLAMMPHSSELQFGPHAHIGHPGTFGTPSVLQSLHPGGFFPVLHPEQPPDKPQVKRDMANVYHPSGPFLPPEYIQDGQGHQVPPYGSHVIQGMHVGGSYVHPLNFQGYPEQYDPEKEWGS